MRIHSRPSADSKTSDETEDSDNHEVINWSDVETNLLKCNNTSSNDTSDAPAAAERDYDARKLEANNEVIVACKVESATGDMISASAASPFRDIVALAQLYHPHRRSKRSSYKSNEPYSKHPSPPPQLQGNALEDVTAGMIGPFTANSFNETIAFSSLYHPIRQTKKNIKSMTGQDSSGRLTLPYSTSSSEAAELIWEEIQNAIGNTDEDDWSFNGSPPLKSTETEKTKIPGAIAFNECSGRDRKRRKSFHAVMGW